MEILSKDILELLRDPGFRKSLGDLLEKSGTEPKVLTVPTPKDDDDDEQNPDSSTPRSRSVIVRRLSA